MREGRDAGQTSPWQLYIYVQRARSPYTCHRTIYLCSGARMGDLAYQVCVIYTYNWHISHAPEHAGCWMLDALPGYLTATVLLHSGSRTKDPAHFPAPARRFQISPQHSDPPSALCSHDSPTSHDSFLDLCRVTVPLLPRSLLVQTAS